MNRSPIYLDHNASTPPAPEVVEAMLPWLREGHANPHSDHIQGRRAAAAVEAAKASIGALVGADGDDIVLTSGATESNNLILQGYLRNAGGDRCLIHSTAEHKSVMETAEALKQSGVVVQPVAVDRAGRIDSQTVRAAVDACGAKRVLVSIIHANNEIGAVAPLATIAEALKGSSAVFHSDASQSAGRVPIDVSGTGIDFLSMSSHKVYGPAGIGAAYVAPDLRKELQPMMYGGGQQDGLRPGTIPVFLAVGFGVACGLAMKRMDGEKSRVGDVTEAFLSALGSRGIAFEVLGDPAARLPGLLSIRLLAHDARDLLDRIGLKISASTGSACTAGELRASHVLKAIGLSDDAAHEVVRFGFGRETSIQEATAAGLIVGDACAAYRAVNA